MVVSTINQTLNEPHSRDGGSPGCIKALKKLDSRLRGNDGCILECSDNHVNDYNIYTRVFYTVVFLFCVIFTNSALAAVEFCNRLSADLEASFGYIKSDGAWAAKGWYVIPSNTCQVIHGADDIATLNNNAVYYYYASSFVNDNHLIWAGSKNDTDAKEFCVANNIYDSTNDINTCESKGMFKASFLPIIVPAEQGVKHVVEFTAPTSQTSK